MSARMVYMTAGSIEEARAIAETLIGERLAACVNILPGMISLYRWEGKIADDNETVVIAKTRANLVPELTKRVSEIHSYDCPCIVSVPIDGGNPAFLSWIDTETTAADSPSS